MILVDTSTWIDHLRRADSRLVQLLDENLVAVHPWVVGELALGSLAKRVDFIRFLGYLPSLRPEKDEQVLALIETRSLWGRGIGWVDAGLLSSCLVRHCQLMTRDKRLAVVARELDLAVEA